jgi:hypothetical protein
MFRFRALLLLLAAFILAGCSASQNVSMTANSYTQEFEPENVNAFRAAVSHVYSVEGFRVFEADSTYRATFRELPGESMGSRGYKSQVAVVWSPEPGVVRIHGWTKHDDHALSTYNAISTPDTLVREYASLEPRIREAYNDILRYGSVQYNE